MATLKELYKHLQGKHPQSRHAPKSGKTAKGGGGSGLTIVEQDNQAAQAIRSSLTAVVNSRRDGVAIIKKNVSSFNSPGLNKAYDDAIKAGARDNKKGFQAQVAKERLDNYYEGRDPAAVDTQVHRDRNAADQIRGKLGSTFDDMEAGSKLISDKVSSFNSPGLSGVYLPSLTSGYAPGLDL